MELTCRIPPLAAESPDRSVPFRSIRQQRFSAGLAYKLKRPTVSEFRVIESGPTTAEIQIAEGSDHAVENGTFIWKGDWGRGQLLAQEAYPAERRCWRSNVSRVWDSKGQKEAKTTDLGKARIRLEYSSEGTGLKKDYQ